MADPTEDDVEQVIREAHRLDDMKQRILADMRTRGEDTDDVRVIVAHRTKDGDYQATELMKPAWMRETPPTADEPEA